MHRQAYASPSGDRGAGALASEATGAAAHMLALQRTAGNRVVTTLLRQRHDAPAQATLTAQPRRDSLRPLPPEAAPARDGTTVALYERGDMQPLTGAPITMEEAFRLLAVRIAGQRGAIPVDSVEQAVDRLRGLARTSRRIRRVAFVGHGFAASFAMHVRRRDGLLEVDPDLPGHTASFRFAAAGVQGDNPHVRLAHAIGGAMRGRAGSVVFLACSTGAVRDMPGTTAYASLTQAILATPGGGPSEVAVHGFGEPAHIHALVEDSGRVLGVMLDRDFDVHVTQRRGEQPRADLPPG